MKFGHRSVFAVLLFLIVLVSALPVFAGEGGYEFSASVDGCTLYVEFTIPGRGPLVAKSETPALFAKAAVANNAFVIIPELGINEGIPDPIGSVVFRSYSLAGVAPGTLINVFIAADSVGNIIFGAQEVESTDDCGEVEVILPTADCPFPPSPLLGQGRVIGPVTTYWAPRLDAGTANPVVVLPVGTSWWILEARDGFYKLFIACQASYVWVTAESLGANFDVVWGGAPLPDAGEVQP